MRSHWPSLRVPVVTAFALLLSIGPLGLLQVVAWTGMALDYSVRYGLATGLERTFDGEHPCGLCTKISEARQERSNTASDASVIPVKLVCLEPPAAVCPVGLRRSVSHDYFIRLGALATRFEAPPSPPPRTLAA